MTKNRKQGEDQASWRPELGEDVSNVLESLRVKKERDALNIVLGNVLRICTRANDMIERDDLWRVRKKPTANEVLDVVADALGESAREYRRCRRADLAGVQRQGPHPALSVAEQLAAKALATFGGPAAVDHLARWKQQASNRHPSGGD